jgi:hypothetical protein
MFHHIIHSSFSLGLCSVSRVRQSAYVKRLPSRTLPRPQVREHASTGVFVGCSRHHIGVILNDAGYGVLRLEIVSLEELAGITSTIGCSSIPFRAPPFCVCKKSQNPIPTTCALPIRGMRRSESRTAEYMFFKLGVLTHSGSGTSAIIEWRGSFGSRSMTCQSPSSSLDNRAIIAETENVFFSRSRRPCFYCPSIKSTPRLMAACRDAKVEGDSNPKQQQRGY